MSEIKNLPFSYTPAQLSVWFLDQPTKLDDTRTPQNRTVDFESSIDRMLALFGETGPDKTLAVNNFLSTASVFSVAAIIANPTKYPTSYNELQLRDLLGIAALQRVNKNKLDLFQHEIGSTQLPQGTIDQMQYETEILLTLTSMCMERTQPTKVERN